MKEKIDIIAPILNLKELFKEVEEGFKDVIILSGKWGTKNIVEFLKSKSKFTTYDTRKIGNHIMEFKYGFQTITLICDTDMKEPLAEEYSHLMKKEFLKIYYK